MGDFESSYSPNYPRNLSYGTRGMRLHAYVNLC